MLLQRLTARSTHFVSFSVVQLSDPDDWLAGLPASADGEAIVPAISAGGEDEALGVELQSAVLAARGSNADMDVLQVHLTTAGPFSKRGTYRYQLQLWMPVRVYDLAGFCCIRASTSSVTQCSVAPPVSDACDMAHGILMPPVKSAGHDLHCVLWWLQGVGCSV